jgi:hypothetical protein
MQQRPAFERNAAVDVHRVLSRQDDADAEGAGLFDERDERSFRRRIRGVRREEADVRLEIAASRQAADPRQDLLERSCRQEVALSSKGPWPPEGMRTSASHASALVGRAPHEPPSSQVPRFP